MNVFDRLYAYVIQSRPVNQSNPNDHTRRSGAFDPDQTLRHSGALDSPPPQPIQPQPVQPPQGPARPRGAPPPMRPKRRRRPRWQVRLRRAGGCLFRVMLASGLFVVLFTGLMAALYWIAPPPRTNILVMGLDARPGEGSVTRTDSMMLVTVDPKQPYVGMLSIPRDTYVNVPNYGMNRINTAHVLGENEGPGRGPQLAADTIEGNFGVVVHRTVRINFEGFVAIIDAAGGIDIDVPGYFIDYEYPTADYGTMVVEFQPGLQHMDGERALIYARTRHAASDFERVARQQQVISALMKKLIWPGNWPRVPLVYAAFTQHVDTDVTIIDAVLLAPAGLFVGPNNIDSRVLDRQYLTGMTTANGASVLDPDWNAIHFLMEEMFRR